MTQPRQPRGTPTGGQFSGTTHDEAGSVLVDGDGLDLDRFYRPGPFDDPVAYTYLADNYTPDGIVEAMVKEGRIHPEFAAENPDAETVLNEVATLEGTDRDDEYTFDSDDFPKTVTSTMMNPGDSVMDTAGNYKIWVNGDDCGGNACGRASCVACGAAGSSGEYRHGNCESCGWGLTENGDCYNVECNNAAGVEILCHACGESFSPEEYLEHDWSCNDEARGPWTTAEEEWATP